MPGISVVIPAYNEKNGIGPVIEQVRSVLEASGWDFELIVVDDASSDGTAEGLQGLGVKVIAHEFNRGYGASLKDGILSARYEFVLITDADGTYPPEAIPALMEKALDSDMAVGSRTGKKVAIPAHRRFPKWLLGKTANYLAGFRIPDLNSGLRVFRRENALRFFNLYPDGFSFTTTITLAFLSNGMKVSYLPIDYRHREGRSKFRPIQDTANLFSLILRTSLYFHPLKIFVPAGLILMGGGLALLVHRLIRGSGGQVTTVVLLMAGLQLLALGLLADLVDKRSQR